MEQKSKQFPAGFLWGAATSSYQIEGGLRNDWSEWENSKKRVTDLERRGLNPVDFQSGKAADSWNRFEEDIACLKKINASAYRFSIEWSRVEPEQGKFDEAALEKYAHFVSRLKEENIEPFVTLWHWPLPLWLSDKGGWENKDVVSCFLKYAEKVVTKLSNVKFWITLNEPEGYAGNSYLIGIWPPQKINLFAHHRVLANLVKAHHAASAMIKRTLPTSLISIATPRAHFVPDRDPISRLFAAFASWWWNDRFLRRIISSIDFIGLNYYWWINVTLLSYSKVKGPNVSDMGWTINAEGLYFSLKNLQQHNKPIYITENGLADEHDMKRSAFIVSMLKSTHRAIAEGVDVRGYLHWSLIDNFEWGHGYTKKFGLFEIVPQTLERKARPSVEVYAKIIKNNSL